MQLAIDKFGRIVLPKAMRDDLALGPGSVLSIETEGEDIRLRPVRDEDAVKRKDGVLVFAGRATGDVAGALRAHREGRLARLGRPGRAG